MNGPALNSEYAGAGPPVVLLHGFTGSIRSWDAVTEWLARDCAVLRIDLPGHGQSPAPSDPARYRLPYVAELIEQVLDDRGIERATIAGYSMGGRTALRFALNFPDRCAGLVLESTSPGIADEEARRQRQANDEELARILETEGLQAFVRKWEQLPLWASQLRLDPATIAHQRAIRMAQSPAGLANSLRGAGAGVEPSVLGELRSLSMPVLLLAGALDPAYVAHAKAMASRIAGATIYVEPEAGHAMHLERPLRVASLVHRFALSAAR